jgi:hypothetical protein
MERKAHADRCQELHEVSADGMGAQLHLRIGVYQSQVTQVRSKLLLQPPTN